jgi:hypothetical protein
LVLAIPLRKERGIHAASMHDGNQRLENFELSVLWTLKRAEARAPAGARACVQHLCRFNFHPPNATEIFESHRSFAP